MRKFYRKYVDLALQPLVIIRCALQYVLLHLLGYKLSLDDLKGFRQVDSKTPGHPEVGHTDGMQRTIDHHLFHPPDSTFNQLRNRGNNWSPRPGIQ